MDKEAAAKLREQFRPHLKDFLRNGNVDFYPPALTVCPHCGGQAGLNEDGTWLCPKLTGCGAGGDVVDYAMENLRMPEHEAIRFLCRMFGIRITELDYVTSDEVMDMEFHDPVFVVDGLLSKGLTLFAGSSKIGKSWLALWLAHRISTGQTVWGFASRPCEVMYLCLEDTLDRLQRRLIEVTGGETGTIYLATDAEIMGNGLEEQLIGFLSTHPKVGVVIIDTLQKIRELGSEKAGYAGDYNAMTRLKGIADRFGVTLLAIHQTRKAKSNDPFQMVSGTTGLMGCADNTFVMLKDNRAENRTKLFGTGRDIRDKEFSLCFQKSPMDWVLEDCTVGSFRPSRDRELTQIATFILEKQTWEGTATELAEALTAQDAEFDVKPNALVRILNANASLLAEHYGFQFSAKRVGNAKLLRLTAGEAESI